MLAALFIAVFCTYVYWYEDYANILIIQAIPYLIYLNELKYVYV